jgi:hypothetical protein
MAEIDEFLASLEDDEPEVDPKKLGYALRQEQKQRAALEREVVELREFRAVILLQERMSALKAAGFNDFHTETFLKYFDEVSEENVAAYRKKAGLRRK